MAHDAVTAAHARQADYLFIDTADRTPAQSYGSCTSYIIIGKQLPGAHKVLLVLDGSTGMNALNPGPANSARPCR